MVKTISLFIWISKVSKSMTSYKTIKIKKQTHAKLWNLMQPSESFDGLFNRLIDNKMLSKGVRKW